MPQQKHTLPQPFRDENYFCLAAVRNDMRGAKSKDFAASAASASPFKKLVVVILHFPGRRLASPVHLFSFV